MPVRLNPVIVFRVFMHPWFVPVAGVVGFLLGACVGGAGYYLFTR